jgi:hypothetical protein
MWFKSPFPAVKSSLKSFKRVLKEKANEEISMVFALITHLVWLTFSQSAHSSLVDPCTGTVPIGTVCSGGALYAGEFEGGRYMVLPKGCHFYMDGTHCREDSDEEYRAWNPEIWMVDIPGITNVLAASSPSPSSERGDVTTPLIKSSMSSGEWIGSAAQFCHSMHLGGFRDWYLPSKSELAFLYCHSKLADSNSNYGPDEDPQCERSGGRSFELKHLRTSYWSSTERGEAVAWIQNFFSGEQHYGTKTYGRSVTCVRRYK